jgi:tRNA(Ile)-lysidine synthase
MLALQYFKDHISSNALFSEGHKVLLAVSGGKDSVLMAHLFKLAGYQFGIAHCNFGLRADESQRDESFVRILAATLDVPFHVTHFKTKDYAAANKVSTQMAARTLRYAWFEEVRLSHGYEVIALAQHQDDVMETVLLNLTRGTGIAGLHGILPKRGKLIRPMLFLRREEIDRLIDSNNLDYVEDSSNLYDDYARNKIRHHVVPRLKEINPSLGHTFQQNVRRFAEVEMVLQSRVAVLREQMLTQRGHNWHLSIVKIKALFPQHLLLFELLKPFDFSEAVVGEVLQSLHKQSGTRFYSSTHRLIIDRKELIVDLLMHQGRQSVVFIHQHDQFLALPRHQISISSSALPFFEKTSNKAFVDAVKLIYPLLVRVWQPGDKFSPIGMKNFKKLSDFFIDERVPLSEKEHIPLLINGNGEVIWVCGLRQDDRYKVTASTKKTIIFELKPSYYIT